MTQEEYDEFLHGRSDFIKATKKDSSNERKVSVVVDIRTVYLMTITCCCHTMSRRLVGLNLLLSGDVSTIMSLLCIRHLLQPCISPVCVSIVQ